MTLYNSRANCTPRVSSKLTRCLPEVNRFAAVAKPYNLEQIKRDDVIGADDEQVRWFMLETKTHEIYFLTNSLGQPRICSFQPKGINIAPLTEWDAPTGKWSEEEALAETLRIVKLLGMRFTMSRYKVYARERPLKNAPGVKVTPLYDVGLYGADGRLGVNAIFYVGETGPGRLVLWGVSDPDDW